MTIKLVDVYNELIESLREEEGGEEYVEHLLKMYGKHARWFINWDFHKFRLMREEQRRKYGHA